jgi:hypothetical protein
VNASDSIAVIRNLPVNDMSFSLSERSLAGTLVKTPQRSGYSSSVPFGKSMYLGNVILVHAKSSRSGSGTKWT